MVELDGVEYPIRTPEENAQDLIGRINDYCASNNIVNNQGDLISIDANETNPLYMMCFGMGYLMTDLQKLVYSAGCSMSINESSERQLLNLADIADVQRKAATKTTVIVTIYAELPPEDDEEEGTPCEITQYNSETGEGCRVTVAYGNQSLTFIPAYELVGDNAIPPGGAATMTLVCEQEGSYSLAENLITSFDVNPTGFRMMTSMESSPGQDQETITALRERIQYRDMSYTQIDAAILAIDNLDGVSSCNIYFNYSSMETVTVSGVEVPPRQAMIIVQGWSNDIPEAFYKNMSCQTVGDDGERSQKLIYTTQAGQSIPVYIFRPNYVPVYMHVYIKGTYTNEDQQGFKDTICGLASRITVGEELTSAAVINLLKEKYPALDTQGCLLSLDAGTNFTYIVTPGSDDLITFNVENITLYVDSPIEIDQ